MVQRGGPGGVELDKQPMLSWAVRTDLGQGDGGDGTLLAAVRERRRAALRALGHAGYATAEVRLVPEAAILTGTGEQGVQEVGIALHGTYGWPAVRGSTLKGVADAYARGAADPPEPEARRGSVFGLPRVGVADDEPARGEVAFLDALPAEPLPVTMHVLTPHVRDYYAEPAPGASRQPPAEYHNPVPVTFLAVGGERSGQTGQRQTCGFMVTLVGNPGGVAAARRLLVEAVTEIGLGAKTAAGYGYLKEESRRR
jgi:CRISPR-associated protein Cmr6